MAQEQTAGAAVSLRERVSSPPAQTLVDSYYSFAVAAGIRFQFEPEMRIHFAHGLMVAERGIVSAADIARTFEVLLDLRRTGPGVLSIDYRQEDLYSYIERHIVQTLGPEVGGRLHTGRSRNDLHVTSWRLALRERLINLIDALARVRARLLDLAQAHVDTVMPGYTHTQHAQPITFGYYGARPCPAAACADDLRPLPAGLGRALDNRLPYRPRDDARPARLRRSCRGRL